MPETRPSTGFGDKVAGMPKWLILVLGIGGVFILYQWRKNQTSSQASMSTQPGGSTNMTSPAVFFLPQGAYSAPAAPNVTVNVNPTLPPPRTHHPPNGGGPVKTPPPPVIPPSPQKQFAYVTVAKWTHNPVWNSTLWGIARHYGTPGGYNELAQINNIPNPNLIYPGQVVKVPLS